MLSSKGESHGSPFPMLQSELDEDESNVFQELLEDTAAALYSNGSAQGWTPVFITFPDDDSPGGESAGSGTIRVQSKGTTNGKRITFDATCCPCSDEPTGFDCDIDAVVFTDPSATDSDIQNLMYSADSAQREADYENSSPAANNFNLPSFM